MTQSEDAAVTPRACVVCGTEIAGRSDRLTCSSRCRQVRSRSTRAYVVTEADRAAMRRAAELVPIPVPALTDEQVRAWVAAHAERT